MHFRAYLKKAVCAIHINRCSYNVFEKRSNNNNNIINNKKHRSASATTVTTYFSFAIRLLLPLLVVASMFFFLSFFLRRILSTFSQSTILFCYFNALDCVRSLSLLHSFLPPKSLNECFLYVKCAK